MWNGPENQLYRVEIHNSGTITGANQDEAISPTFKWSSENGSVIFPITEFSGEKVITLEHLGRDCRFGLEANDWVEIVDDDYILQNQAAALVQIEDVDSENSQVTLKHSPQSQVGTDQNKHPYLRRWDQKDGDSNGVLVKEGNDESDWISLEDGVEIQFPKPDEDNDEISHLYQTGDYWLIPARTATGDVEWPGPVDAPLSLPPQGVEHYYAPLAKIKVSASGVEVKDDLRRKIRKMW